MTPDRLKQIESEAQALRSSLGAGAWPLTVDALTNKMGLQVSKLDIGTELAGTLVIKGGKLICIVSDNLSPEWQSFAIAQMVAHYRLHQEPEREGFFLVPRWLKGTFGELGNNQHKTLEARVFAMNLLLPEAELTHLLDKEQPELLDELQISLLAKRLGVSLQLLGYRLGQLKLYV